MNKGIDSTPALQGQGKLDFLRGEELLELRGTNLAEDATIRSVLSQTRPGPFEYFAISAGLPKLDDPREERETMAILLRILRQLTVEKRIPKADFLGEAGGRPFLAFAFSPDRFTAVEVLVYRRRVSQRITEELTKFSDQFNAGKRTAPPVFN